jgi:hypothetical protein
MTFVEMLNKALTDQDFASLVVSDPAAALSQVGYEATQKQVDALRAAADAMIVAGEVLDDIRIANV